MKRMMLIWVLLLGLLGGSLGSCSSSRNAYNRDDIYGVTMPSKKKKAKKPQRNNHQKHIPDVAMTKDARKVLDEAIAWIGTPYKLGGNTRRGIDCSGLTCMAFEKAIGLKLPRNSGEQARFSRRIRRSDIRPGDLVFFVSRRGGDRINHVAIYMGDNSIIHSTSSQGVTVSCLDEEYWKSHFYSCGRVL